MLKVYLSKIHGAKTRFRATDYYLSTWTYFFNDEMFKFKYPGKCLTKIDFSFFFLSSVLRVTNNGYELLF